LLSLIKIKISITRGLSLFTYQLHYRLYLFLLEAVVPVVLKVHFRTGDGFGFDSGIFSSTYGFLKIGQSNSRTLGRREKNSSVY